MTKKDDARGRNITKLRRERRECYHVARERQRIEGKWVAKTDKEQEGEGGRMGDERGDRDGEERSITTFAFCARDAARGHDARRSIDAATSVSLSFSLSPSPSLSCFSSFSSASSLCIPPCLSHRSLGYVCEGGIIEIVSCVAGYSRHRERELQRKGRGLKEGGGRSTFNYRSTTPLRAFPFPSRNAFPLSRSYYFIRILSFLVRFSFLSFSLARPCGKVRREETKYMCSATSLAPLIF